MGARISGRTPLSCPTPLSTHAILSDHRGIPCPLSKLKNGLFLPQISLQRWHPWPNIFWALQSRAQAPHHVWPTRCPFILFWTSITTARSAPNPVENPTPSQVISSQPLANPTILFCGCPPLLVALRLCHRCARTLPREPAFFS